MEQFQKGTSPLALRQASRALPSHGGTAASFPFQTSSGDPPSAPEASGEAGTLVLAPGNNIPECTPPLHLITFLPTLDSWQHGRAGASGCSG